MIGIHHRPGSYSERWLAKCQSEGIPHKVVDCLGSDVIQACRGLRGVLWHWPHHDPASLLVARQVVASLEMQGCRVFPGTASCWHYDDKVAQKYLLEAIDAPLIPTWVFTSAESCLSWIDQAKWPKVFKLRCGAGSRNVRLVRSQSEARVLCGQAFGRGFPASGSYFSDW